MPKKLLLLLCVLPLLLPGCRSNRRIETAGVIENVSVHAADGQTVYTFYLLTDSPRSEAVDVSAPSFAEAVRLAEEAYIPHLTLAKLGLLLIEQGVSRETLWQDIEYIAGQANVSPVAKLALCDSKTLRRLRQVSATQERMTNLIDRLEQENPGLMTDYLSVFNACEREEAFLVPLITCEGDIKAASIVLMRNA